MEHKPLLMGHWNNDRNGRYDRPRYEGEAANLDLIEIPEEYNVIVVSTPYMHDRGFPKFKPHNQSNGEFHEQVENLTSKGRQVLFNLQNQHVNGHDYNYNEEILASRIMNILVGNRFSGICINLDREIMDEKDNQVVIPAALKLLKKWCKEENRDFSICISSYFSDLGEDNKGLPYLAELEGHYDLVCANLYEYIAGGGYVFHSLQFDKGGDWISEDDDEQKENFLYGMMDSFTNGTRGFPKIPHDKLVLGLTANQDATHKGHVSDPSAVLNAMERLKQSGTPIRGLSAYTINWDAGQDKDGQPHSHEFINRYKGIITPV
ncbi:chitinase [Priestia aryabhattai]|uniref:chitinase n=1 Tax=Priestia aryabhattai TaxID=412384 RepID=UPI001FB555A4|nr:chitinase [Priestia aryabhattai]